MITDQQRERRKGGIFSSDVARVMEGQGVEVYLEKIGEREPPEIGELEYVQLGNLLETAGMDAFAKGMVRPGEKLVRSPDTMRSLLHPWLGAHLDGIHEKNPVEVKAVGVYNRRLWGEPGSDQVPNRVMWQVQAQMAVLGAPCAFVPVVFATEENLTRFIVSGRVEIEIYNVTRSERLIEAIYERCGELWGCVEAKIPPQVTRTEDAALLYDFDRGTMLQATPQLLAAYQALCALRAGARKIEQKIEQYEGLIQSALGTHASLRYEGQELLSWRRIKDTQILDGAAVQRANPQLWANCLKTKKGTRVFKVNEEPALLIHQQLREAQGPVQQQLEEQQA